MCVCVCVRERERERERECVCVCVVRIYYSSILDRILTQVKLALPMQSCSELCEFVPVLSSDESVTLEVFIFRDSRCKLSAH